MKVIWHQSSHIDSRVMEIQPPHELGDWEIYHPRGVGDGVLLVGKGATAVAPPEIQAMLRVKGTWRVISDTKGFFIVTVYQDRQWNRIEAELIQAYVIAKEKVDAARNDPE